MQSVLYKYLVLYKKLDVPGVGNFTIETTPATLEFTNQQLQPPESHIKFSPVVRPTNNHFYSFLSREWSVDKVIAIRRYKEAVEDLLDELKRMEMCEIKYIGILRKTGSGTIAFTEAEHAMPVFSVLPAQRVLRKHSQHTVLVGEQEYVKDYVLPDAASEEVITEEEQPKERWPLYALILAIAAMLMIAVYYITH